MDKSLGTFIDKVQEAKYEAIKRGISANAVAISKDLYFSIFPTSGTPMICGLKAMFTKELPDNTAFAVFELPKVSSDAPTADVVEVVRCKDCKFNVANKEKDPLDITDYSGDDIVCSYFMTDGLAPNDYCSQGERYHKGEQNESNS